MENKFEIFKHEKFGEVRTILIEGEPWFVGKDVANMLGYKDSTNALKSHVDSDDRMGWQITTPSRGTQNISIINESGLYSLILSSKLPTAKEFKRWVTSEVLPTIRKHGFYATDDMLEQMLNNPDMAIGMFQKLKEERTLRNKLEEENVRLSKKARYLDLITESHDAVPISVIASDYAMSPEEMNKKLKALRVQHKFYCGTWVLYKAYMGKGYTITKTVRCPGSGYTFVNMYWTQAGRKFIYDLLKEQGILPECEKSYKGKVECICA